MHYIIRLKNGNRATINDRFRQRVPDGELSIGRHVMQESCCRGWLTQRRSGGSQVVAVMSLLSFWSPKEIYETSHDRV